METPLFEKINYWNGTIVPIISYALNLLLLYFIFKYTTKEMKPYSKILIQGCFVDSFLSTIVLIIKQEVRCTPVIAAFRITGFFENLPHPWNFLLNLLGLFGYIYWLLTIPIPFYYRFMMICKGKVLSDKSFFLLYLLMGVLSLISVTLNGLAFLPTQNEGYLNPFVAKDILKWQNEDNEMIFIATKITNPFVLWSLIYMFIGGTLSFNLILYFSLNIWKQMQKQKGIMSDATRKVQQQLNYILFVQAISPLICFLPVLMFLISFIFKVDSFHPESFTIMLAPWFTIINPICVIMFVKPYREKILCKKHIIKTNITVLNHISY